MAIKLGKYSVCILDLVTDSRTGRLSASKLWLHIGNGILSYVMIKHDAADWELMATYGAVVAGSYVGIIFFKLRWGNAGGAIHSGNAGDMLGAAYDGGEVDSVEPPERTGSTSGRVRSKRKKAGRAKQ